jgi:hypothetical protein
MNSEFDYKKYSLEKLETWMSDALTSAEASPQEIYDTIRKVVEEEYDYHKHNTGRCYELLSLLNGNGKGHLTCDRDDKSPECQKAWSDFWEENYYPEEVKDDGMRPWGHSDLEYKNWAHPESGIYKNQNPEPNQKQYTEEELNAMCDKAASDDEKNKCREYNLREAEYYNQRARLDAEMEAIKAAGGYEWTPEPPKDKVIKWQLPVEIDGASGEYFVQFPDDLLKASKLKEGDQVEWVDQGDGSYLLKKV